MKDKTLICQQVRTVASDSLYTVLQELLSKETLISETILRNRWLSEMQKNKTIFPHGWYEPPPSGITVLFATSDDMRADFTNLRPETYWPKENIFLDRKEGFAYLFASPIDRETAIAGDFSINIYFGKNPIIIDNMKRSLEVDYKIYDFLKIGQTFSEVFLYAGSLIDQAGMKNNIVSITDPDSLNIGHTIPFSYEDLSKEELQTLHSAEKNWQVFTSLVSKKRRFVNRRERLQIKSEMAFTIEPALKVIDDSSIPMTMFHNTAVFHKNGKKELLRNFDTIFKLVGMNYMLE